MFLTILVKYLLKMSGITEIAFAPLKKGINVTDPGSDAYKTLTEEAFRRIKGWKACQRVYWGVEIEDPDKLRLFVNWDSLEAHEEANKDPSVMIKIGVLRNDQLTQCHA